MYIKWKWKRKQIKTTKRTWNEKKGWTKTFYFVKSIQNGSIYQASIRFYLLNKINRTCKHSCWQIFQWNLQRQQLYFLKMQTIFIDFHIKLNESCQNREQTVLPLFPSLFGIWQMQKYHFTDNNSISCTSNANTTYQHHCEFIWRISVLIKQIMGWLP